MGRILKEPRGHSIQEGLVEYGWEFLRLNFVLSILFATLFFFVVVRHKQDTNYFLALNKFYTQLEQTNNCLYENIVENQPQSITDIGKELTGMKEELEKLEQLSIGAKFWRDMDDLRTMFGRYSVDVKEIYRTLTAAENTEAVFALYADTQDIFNFLNKDFQKMYAQILTYVATRENRQWKEHLLILGVCVGICIFWTRRKLRRTEAVAKRIADPVKQLAGKARQIEEGDFLSLSGWEQERNTFTEIEILQHVFRTMLEKLRRQMQEIIENADLREQVQRSEIRALQMQINPHFLFNTLSAIAKTAYMENAECTVLLLEGTASLLRYTLDNSMQMVSLEKELEMSKNYVSIQENRFGDRILFRFDLDRSLKQIQVPRLILQPILENAVIHGVGLKVKDARIQIRTYRQGDRCILSVTDNGEGISAERLEEVVEKMKKGSQDGKNIGLCNIYARLRFFFGETAQLYIESRPGCETRVSVAFPILQEADGDV